MNGGFGGRRRPSGPVLSREASVRQGQAVRAAMAALPDAGAASLFLNSHHAGLGARPLDLAVESDIGLAAVEAAISAGSGRDRHQKKDIAMKPTNSAAPAARELS